MDVHRFAAVASLKVVAKALRPRGVALIGLVVVASLVASGGSGIAQSDTGCTPKLEFSAQAFRTGSAEVVKLEVIHSNACRASITVTAADGHFERLSIHGGARRAFRLDAGNLCKLTRIERSLLPPGATTRRLEQLRACEQEVLALAVERVSAPLPSATAPRQRTACTIVPIFERLSSATARARREAIAVDVNVAQVQNPPGSSSGPALEIDTIDVTLADPTDPSVAAPIAGFPVDRAQLNECDAR